MSSIVDSARNTLAENVGGPAGKLARPEHQFSLDDVPDQTDKVALVTGGSEGIGYAVSHTLLSRNIAHLYLLSVSKEVVEGALDAMREELGQDVSKRVTWLQCDMSDWYRVHAVGEEVLQKASRLDILVNNAARGIMTYALTDSGVDRHMAVNHFGHALLTAQLLPLLERTAAQGSTVRIVNQASNAHTFASSDTAFASLAEMNRDLGPNGLYGRSKLANMLHARYLARHITEAGHPRVLANSTHPGFVATEMSTRDIHEAYPLGGYAMSVGMQPFKKDNFQGALSALFAATKTEKSGEYICPPAIPEAGSELAQDEALGEQLMKLTEELIKEKTGYTLAGS